MVLISALGLSILDHVDRIDMDMSMGMGYVLNSPCLSREMAKKEGRKRMKKTWEGRLAKHRNTLEK